MFLFYRYSRRTLLFLAIILAVEYAVVHRISLDALTRSDVGLSQWRQLLRDCNCTDCEVRHLTLIHDGLYQRAYSAHLLHRVLAISSEDGDPYDAFDDVDNDDDEVDGDESIDDVDPTDGAQAILVPSLPDVLGVPYAYAPGDMLSTPPPVQAALQAAGSRSSASGDASASALPALATLTEPTAPFPPHHHHQHGPRDQQLQHLQQPQQRMGPAPGSSLPAAAAASGGTAAVASASWADGAASASGSPRLLQAVVWQPSKVLSVFPWQLRAHFFLSLTSTRMYLLMGLWPRTAAVVAAAPRRLRQPVHAHTHAHPVHQQPHQHQQQPTGQAHGQEQAGGPAGNPAGTESHGGHDQAASASAAAVTAPPPYGYVAATATSAGAGTGGFSHPHAQAQATAHAYAQHAHGYDSMSGGSLYGIGRTVSDESQSLAAALSALGRGVPVFLPPEMLVEHGVQEDLMASCVFKPAVRHAGGGAAAGTGVGAGDGGFSASGFSPLPRWRTWSSLLGRWMARLAGRIKHHGGRAAAKLRAAGARVGSGGGRNPLRAADGSDAAGGGGGSGSSDGVGRRLGASEQQPQRGEAPGGGSVGAGAGATSQQQQQYQHSYAYVECRLYRTDRARNVSYTCPAVLTVLPSPPRGAGRSALHYQPHFLHPPHHHPAAPAHAASGSAGGSPPPSNQQQQHHHHHHHQGPRLPRPRPRLLRRLWMDLRYMSYGVVMPYKWAPILAGVLSPHMFLLACLPAVQSLGLWGPFTARLCAYHAVCIVLTGADHLLLLRLASELWVRARPLAAGRGPAGRSWRRWLALGRWLLVDGFVASGWMFRAVVMGIITTKQMELWNHLYGTSFRPHPLLSFCLVLPASWLTACAACSAVWRLAGGHQPTSAPLLLFQEGFLSGLSSPLYSLVYMSFAVLGLGGGGVGGGAGGVLGLAAAGLRVPLWLVDAVAVSPLLTVVALDVLWNMDAAARATPLLMVIVNALRVHQAQDEAVGGAFGRRGRGLLGGGGAAAAAGAVGAGGAAAGGDAGGGGGLGLDWVPPRLQAVREGPGGGARLKQHTSLWMLLEPARWWAHQVRDAVEEERRAHEHHHQQQQHQHQGGAAQGPGGAGVQERARLAVARVALAARHAGMVELPRSVIAGMMAALLLPRPGEPWPPLRAEQAHALDLLLVAVAEAGAGPARGRGGRGGGGAGGGGAAADEDLDLDADGLDDLMVAAAHDGGGEAGDGEGGAEGEERMVRAPDGSLRPLSALEAELRAGLAQVAALRSQLAAVGRGVADLLLLGRWPPPLELPAEALCWCESVPHGFLCPITHSLMTQPALLVSPQLSEASPTYELSAIRQWLRNNRTDPTTGRYLHTYHFIHNDNLRKAIEDWVTDRLDREQQQQQQQRQEQQQQQQVHHSHCQQLRQRQRHLSPAAARPQWGSPTASAPASNAAAWQRTGASGGDAAAAAAAARMRSPHRGRSQQPSSMPGGADAARGGGRYLAVAGPGPGQRSVCVGTSEMGLRMQSPERLRGSFAASGSGQLCGGGGGGGAAMLEGRSHSRGQSRSRGRALRPAGAADGGGGEDAGGAGSSAASVLARQAVQRAASRQRGLQRTQPQ